MPSDTRLRQLAGRPWRLLWLALFALALLTVLLMTGDIIRLLAGHAGGTIFTGPRGGLTMIAGAAYLLAHFVRIGRLALLIGDSRLSLRQLVAVHLFTSSANLAIPFKLGEPYRVIELSTVTHGGFVAIGVVWIERCFDVSAILLMLLVAAMFDRSGLWPYHAILWSCLAFVLSTLAVVTLLPDNLRRLGNHIIRRYEGRWTLTALDQIGRARTLFHNGSRMMHGRYASMAVLTAIIWILEGASLALILMPDRLEAGLLTFLNSILQGQTLPPRLAPVLAGEAMSPMVVYAIATQGMLAITGLLSGLYLARERLAALFARGSAMTGFPA